jgi:ornithine cyclodeaminase/alanine dehydrogenase-like protein (mu-crystallin family)
MLSTAEILRRAADLIHRHGLHTGEQFMDHRTGALDVAAAIFVVAESGMSRQFIVDEAESLAIIGASAPAMAAIRTLSDSLPTQPSYTEIVAGHQVPEYIEHVSNWAATTPVWGTRPPTMSEVIGALLRAAQTADTPAQRLAA